MVLCSKAQWCKMILASYHSYTFADNKTIQHENNYRYLIIFQHEFVFCTKQQINGTIAAKTIRKIAFATVAFDATTKSFVKSTATDEKGYYEIQVTNVAFYVQIEILGYKTFKKNDYKYQNRHKSQF
jgi:glucan biosynthesis protein